MKKKHVVFVERRDQPPALQVGRAHRGDAVMRRFSWVRFVCLCACGLNHRRGEVAWLVSQDHKSKRINRCTRCGIGVRKGITL